MKNNKKSREIPTPPFLYSNNLAYHRGDPALRISEYILLSDAYFSAEYVNQNSPYNFYNLVNQEPGEKLILRSQFHCDMPFYPFKDKPDAPSENIQFNKKTNEDYYCNTTFPDDLIAISSLALGVRLKSGGIVREFGFGLNPLGDPYDKFGRPVNFDSSSRYWSIAELNQIASKYRNPILPFVMQPANLNNLAKIESLSKLSEKDIFVLTKSARLYQEAIWVAEFEPQRAWLLLVSAIETSATYWWKCKNIEIHDEKEIEIPESLNRLHNILEQLASEEAVSELKKYIEKYLKTLQKFLKFTLHFFNDDTILPTFSPASLNKKREILKKVYGYRSRALHDGIPFPQPMCFAPQLDNQKKYFDGCPGHGCYTEKAAWHKDDIPLNLHAFSVITRQVLLQWWGSLLN